MKSDTQAITIEAEPAEVFAFVSDPENLPRWAVGFCRSIRRDDNGWRAVTTQGEVSIRYVSDPALGVVDFHLEPAPGVRLVAHSRVLPNGDGAEYVFTQFQPPGMSEADFARQVEALKEELVVLRAILRARAACPA